MCTDAVVDATCTGQLQVWLRAAWKLRSLTVLQLTARCPLAAQTAAKAPATTTNPSAVKL